MVSVSSNLLIAPVVLAMLFLLGTTTATMVEKMPTTTSKEMIPVMVIKEVVIVEQPKIDYIGSRKMNMMIMQPHTRVLDAKNTKQVTTSNTGQVMKCSKIGEQCSFLLFCCAGTSCVSNSFWDKPVCKKV
ncbi:uncharacterized protein LOC110713706 [Chenopodium quinoa]|uniref:uncharacterized protein LOC110713706 n=1 Tax=Chenopodium quinoa TaxID=63459 RepID=UPI000B78B9A1|nr:uncharacterized protein LOC110713706 [Chenopodium quinoa]